MDKVRICIVGMGIGKSNGRALAANPRGRVVALCDLYQDRMEAFAKELPESVRFYTDYKAMCQDPDIDAVMVGTPNQWHAPIALEAVQNGKHVLVTKPLAILEATWTTWNVGVPTRPIVYGTRGALVVTRDLRSTGEHSGQVVEVYAKRSHNLEEPDEIVEPEPLPQGRATIAEEFLHHIETGEPLHPTLDMMQNLQVQAILDAGIRSAQSGKLELVDDATWCIG